jgi:4-amino-4-deoxy-L-arabinose transferase-like glycosyltransferase
MPLRQSNSQGIAAVLMTPALPRLLAPVERLIDALTDPARRERTAVGVLLAYTAIWTLYGVLAKASQDLHFDMVEVVAWSRELALGYPKHPPLAAWLARAWFTVFPVADWAYYLLAIGTAALGLWIAWILSARYLDADKRVLGLALLTLTPFFNFHALKYNVNTVLIPLWAATTLWFLRSFETRSIGYAALAGLGAAACMLGKYWSIFLLAGLGIAALVDSRRGAYFRSAAPWVTVAVGALVLAPHIVWLINHDFVAFAYAAAGHGAKSFLRTASSAVGYLGGALAYVALPLALALIAIRPSRAALADTLIPPRGRRLVAAAFWAPLLLPPVVALVTGISIVSLWTLSAFALFPVVLLSSPLLVVPRQALVAIVAFAIALPPLMTAAAPAIAIAIHRAGVTPTTAHVRLLADRIAHEWRLTTDRPLRLVGGNADLAYGAAFYLPDRPSTFPDFDRRTAPWVDAARVARDGMAVVCFANDRSCIAGAERYAGSGSRRAEVEIARSHFRTSGKPERYVILTVPPSG